MSDKRVSVIMPAYNNASFIGAAIESVVAQTHPHWELLIVDDASSDETLARAEQFQAQDQRIKVFVMARHSAVTTLQKNRLGILSLFLMRMTFGRPKN